MKNHVFAIAAAALLLPGAPLMAQSAPPPTQASVPDPGAKVICKNQQKSGSRFTERKCQTQAEWDAIAEAARKGAEEGLLKHGALPADCRMKGVQC